jgi:hypothetical protein
MLKSQLDLSTRVLAGYYARWAAVRKLLHQFLAAKPSDESGQAVKKQILSLGAGFDTTYFQLQVRPCAVASPLYDVPGLLLMLQMFRCRLLGRVEKQHLLCDPGTKAAVKVS